jgi:hypothetical protein
MFSTANVAFLSLQLYRFILRSITNKWLVSSFFFFFFYIFLDTRYHVSPIVGQHLEITDSHTIVA